jgi:hypothetical protein
MHRVNPALPCVALLLAVLLSGCAHTYQARLFAEASPMARPAGTYRVQVADSPQPMDTHALRETEASVMSALAAKGLLEAPADQPADLVVVIAYDVGARAKSAKGHTYHLDPVDNSAHTPAGPFIALGTDDDIRERLTTDAAAGATSPDNQLYSDQSAEILYQKYLVISAYDAPPVPGRPADHRIWYVAAGIEDEGQALPKYLPILAAACANSLNTNTDRVKKVEIRAEGDTLTVVRKGS